MADRKIQEEARLRYPKVIGRIIATGDLNDYRRDSFIAGAEWQKKQQNEKMKANTLEELVEYLSKRFDVSYAKLARIVVKTAKWQKEQMLKEVVNPAQLPTWRKASNHYEEPCIGSAFEKTGRRYTALYMGDFYIDLDELYDKLPKAAYKEDEK